MLIVVPTCLFLGGELFGLGYWQGQRALRQEMNAQAAKGINSGPVLARFGAGQAMPFLPHPNIPANASPELKEFLQNRATLMQKMAELRQANPPGSRQDVIQQFQQDNTVLLQQQRELVRVMLQAAPTTTMTI
jgi:hypothetical protein